MFDYILQCASRSRKKGVSLDHWTFKLLIILHEEVYLGQDQLLKNVPLWSSSITCGTWFNFLKTAFALLQYLQITQKRNKEKQWIQNHLLKIETWNNVGPRHCWICKKGSTYQRNLCKLGLVHFSSSLTKKNSHKYMNLFGQILHRRFHKLAQQQFFFARFH